MPRLLNPGTFTFAHDNVGIDNWMRAYYLDELLGVNAAASRAWATRDGVQDADLQQIINLRAAPFFEAVEEEWRELKPELQCVWINVNFRFQQ